MDKSDNMTKVPIKSYDILEVVRLQKTVSEYERFCSDLLMMLVEGKKRDVISFCENYAPMCNTIYVKVKDLMKE